ncbi:hypothetical protein NMG60_11020401 [Bertholletia excelsa]
MMGSDFVDEIDCGSFFDQMDDLVEFPADTECGLGSGGCNDFPAIWSDPSDALPGSYPNPFISGNHCNGASDLSAQISVPYEDIVQLEWLSNFMEDSFSDGGVTINKETSSLNNKYQTSSPVSVLESSSSSSSSSNSSCSGGKTVPISPAKRGPHRARSKRPRPATFNPRPSMQLISPTSTENPPSFQPSVASSESEIIAESPPLTKTPRTGLTEHKKKKKLKLTPPLGPGGINNQNSSSQFVRKCMHCEITKTPQWRAGPMGPKTLCNACGVRYKSGRLFPEYRPAASPTFVPSLHSNSHKKVMEMRNTFSCAKTCVLEAEAEAEAELIPNGNPSMDYI